MEEKFTVVDSKIEFIVEGTDNRFQHYWDPVPFCEKTDNWQKALEWMKRLDEINGEPHLTVVKVMTVKESENPVRQTISNIAWKDIDLERLNRKLELLRAEKERCEKRLAKLPTLIEETGKKLDEAVKFIKTVEGQKKTLTLEEFKLACISDEELTDKQVDILMRMVVLESEEEVLEFCAILHKYRPALEKKFAAELKKNKAVR